MGTWEEESSALFESQNEIHSSGGTHHDDESATDFGGNVEVKYVAVVNDDDDDVVNGDDGEVSDEVVQQFARVEIHDNGSHDSKIDDEKRDDECVLGGEESNYEVYPLRPYATDCSFYVKTGTCKFGPNCRYNHPPKRGVQDGTEENYESIGDAGKIQCKYFQTPGGCKYGDACRYIHSTQKTEEERVELNFTGLPIRPSAQECTFYLRNGSCGYGANCRFNHPEFSSTKEYEPQNSVPSSNSAGGGVGLPRNYAGEPLQPFTRVSHGTQDLSNGLNPRNVSPYPPEMSFYPPMRPNPGWNQNQVYGGFSVNKTPVPHHAVLNYLNSVNPSTQYENSTQIEEFPERPGQPDCDYFMKTGNCKYRSACIFNHPIVRVSKLPLPPPVSSKGLFSRPAFMLPADSSQHPRSNSNNIRKNGMPSAQQMQPQMQNGEYPERAGQPECEYYMKTGQCKFKSSCKYHHPRSRVPSSLQCAISQKGLPLRPGAKLCRNYEQQGMCKYGRNCLFNHPDDVSPNIPAATQFHSSTKASVPTNSEPQVATNVNSAWDDGWGM